MGRESRSHKADLLTSGVRLHPGSQEVPGKFPLERCGGGDSEDQPNHEAEFRLGTGEWSH